MKRVSFLLLLCFFLVSGTIGLGAFEHDAWDIERVVTVALQQSETLLKAREDLVFKRLELQQTIPLRTTDLVFEGTTSEHQNAVGNYHQETFTLTIPLLPRLRMGSSYTVQENIPDRFWVELQPLAEDPSAEKRLEYVIAQLELEEAIINTELEARQQYISALAAVKSLYYTKEEGELAEKTEELMKCRHELGLVSEAELQSAKSGALEAKVQLAIVEKNEYTTRMALSRILGTNLLTAAFKELPEFPGDILTEEYILEQALNNNVSMKVAQLRLDYYRQHQAWVKTLKPQLALKAESPMDTWDPALSAALVWRLGADLPLLVEADRLRLQQLERTVESGKDQLITSLKTALLDFKVQRLMVEQLKSLVEQTEMNYLRMQGRFEDGEVLLVDLDKAKLAMKKAKDNYINGWHSLWSAWYSLLAMMAA